MMCRKNGNYDWPEKRRPSPSVLAEGEEQENRLPLVSDFRGGNSVAEGISAFVPIPRGTDFWYPLLPEQLAPFLETENG